MKLALGSRRHNFLLNCRRVLPCAHESQSAERTAAVDRVVMAGGFTRC